MANEQSTVPCKYCDTPTTMTGTKLCDPCWEIRNRLTDALSRGLISFEGSPHPYAIVMKREIYEDLIVYKTPTPKSDSTGLTK